MATRIRRRRRKPPTSAWHKFAIPIVVVVGLIVVAGGIAASWALSVYNSAPSLSSLQPLAIRYPTDAPVYPLKLSRMAAAGSTARVDVFAPWKVGVGLFLLLAIRTLAGLLSTPDSPSPVFVPRQPPRDRELVR